MLYQRRPTAANVERPLDTEPNKVKVTKNEDTLIQESETSAEQVRVNQGREFKELQQQLRLLEGDLAAMRETIENKENKPEIFRLQLEQMEMKTKIKHKKLEVRIRNEFKEALHNINQIKIAEIREIAVKEICDFKKAHTDTDQKEQKKTELQHELEEFNRKIEVRTNDVFEKQRRIERQHEEVKNEIHALIRRDSEIAEMIKTQGKMQDLYVELSNENKIIEKRIALSPIPDQLEEDIEVRTEGTNGKQRQTAKQCQQQETDLYTQAERKSDFADKKEIMNVQISKINEQYKELRRKLKIIEEKDALLPTVDQLNKEIEIRIKDIIDQQRKTEERCEKLTNEFDTQNQRNDEIANKAEGMVEKQGQMENQFEELRREFENIERYICCIIL